MIRTSQELTDIINQKFPDNINGEIDGQDTNDVFIDFTDSFVPKTDYYEGVIAGNLFYQETNAYRIQHTWNTTQIDAVIYNYQGELLGDEFYYLNPLDNYTIDIIFYKKLNISDIHRYLLLNINM